MKASKESVIRGAKEYIQLEIAQRMTGLNAFAVNFLLPSLEKKFSMLYDKYAKDELFRRFGRVECFWWEAPSRISWIGDYSWQRGLREHLSLYKIKMI